MIGDAYPQFFELVSKCLVIDPRERVSAAEALTLSFFAGDNCSCLLQSCIWPGEGVLSSSVNCGEFKETDMPANKTNEWDSMHQFKEKKKTSGVIRNQR